MVSCQLVGEGLARAICKLKISHGDCDEPTLEYWGITKEGAHGTLYNTT